MDAASIFIAELAHNAIMEVARILVAQAAADLATDQTSKSDEARTPSK
jgi:hypothetical protein